MQPTICFGVTCPKRSRCERCPDKEVMNSDARHIVFCRTRDGGYPLFAERRRAVEAVEVVEHEGAID